MEGLRPILIEVQALTVHSVLAVPRRIASGYDFNRLVILLAVLEKRGKFHFLLMMYISMWQVAIN